MSLLAWLCQLSSSSLRYPHSTWGLRRSGSRQFVKHGIVRTSLDDRALKKSDPKPRLIVGIDAEQWVNEAWHLERAGLFVHDTENPMLWFIFCRLARLYGAAVAPLFVRSGAHVPGPRLDSSNSPVPPDHPIFDEMRKFVKAFGFGWHQAPAEALSELSLMNRLSHVDVVISEDSDALVYGAAEVLRRVDYLGSGTITADAMQTQVISDVDLYPLTRGSMLLVALLCGSGDLQPGVDGCEFEVAHKLSRTGLGDRLLDAATTMGATAFRNYLNSWRKCVKRELETNAKEVLDHPYITLSNNIDTSWPNLEVIKMFTNPITSISEGIRFPAAVREAANLGELARLSEFHFSFGTPIGVLKEFESRILPGVAMDALIQHTVGNISTDELKNIASITRFCPFSNRTETKYRMEVNLVPAINAVLNSLAGTRAPVDDVDVVAYVENMPEVRAKWLGWKFSWSIAHAIVQEYLLSIVNCTQN
ncbi:PIN domain-like protein [Schizopora paradoxa]|uniref:PIN domain-like protein n=1 Tax=Schizopora paradoxa TaxID=27342 RepID=A0A0H2R0I8_9AGAM|nr:PIN domain-like protein [Schizopora paradoxa]